MDPLGRDFPSDTQWRESVLRRAGELAAEKVKEGLREADIKVGVAEAITAATAAELARRLIAMEKRAVAAETKLLDLQRG